MSNLINIKIEELGATITGKTPSSNFPEDFGDEFMFITPSDSFDNKTIYQTNRYLSHVGIMKLRNKVLPPKSVLVSCIGSAMGKVIMNNTTSITNQQINSIIVNSKYDPDYVYYCLKNNYKLLRNASSGSTALPMLNKTDFDKLKILIHKDKSAQQKIAKVLSDLDDKIELNNKLNSELEAMAKTFYDYWFVQFDFPNKDGKPYRSSGGKMVWDDVLKREIPEGWEIKELSDIANITMGQSPPGETYNEEGIGAVFYQGCTDFGKRFPTIRKFTSSPTRYAREGEILLSVRAPVGTMNIAKEDCCIGRGLASLNSKDNSISYLFGVMVNLKQIFDRRNVDGTTFGSITKDDLFSLQVIKPSKIVLEKFNSIINPCFERQNKLSVENIELASLRDWLLPMLMNEQVTVGEI